MKIGEIVMVTWDDHTFHADWPPLDGEELATFTTIGYLARNDRRVVAVAASRRHDGSWKDVTAIDKRARPRVKPLPGKVQ